MRIFQDRRDAGKELAQLVARKHYSKPVVLALPRGGLAVAAEVARALKAPLDLVLVRKIGLPSQPELAVGAIVDGHDPVVVINKELQFFVDNHPEEFDRLKRRELEELERRRIVYLRDRPRAPLEGKTVIVVDDGLATGATARAAIEQSYAADEDDEFIFPTIIEGGEAVRSGDPVIFLNFRKDRPRQLVCALFRSEFEHFPRGAFAPAEVTCMMEYDQWYGLPYAFEHERPPTTLAEVVSSAGLKQFHCAETEKYAHVTFFFNGGKSEEMPGEERVLIPSPKVPTYDLQPEMSAAEVADAVIEALGKERYAMVVVNFANGDMVGHTAVRSAILQAVETLDREVGRVVEAARAAGYSVILTADHGNCDEMIDPVSGEPHTQHTVYPVPCLIIDDVPWRLSIGAGLRDIAPTVLHLMGFSKPDAMQGESLLLAPVRG